MEGITLPKRNTNEEQYEEWYDDEGFDLYYENYATKRKQIEDDEKYMKDYYDEYYNDPESIDFALETVKLNYGIPGYCLSFARRYRVLPQVLDLGYQCLNEYNSMYCEIENLIKVNDKDLFAEFITKYHDKLVRFTPYYLYDILVRHCAYGCLAAYLDSDLPSHEPVDLNAPLQCTSSNPMEFAADHLSSGMFSLLLHHGADPDANVHSYVDVYTPLFFAIQAFCSQPFMLDWNPHKSFLVLFNLICSSQLKESLDAVSLLASHSKVVENLCITYIARCDIVEFATLLAAASDKLLNQPERGLDNTFVGNYIIRELQRECSSNRTSKKSKLVNAFNVVKTFCSLKQCGQLAPEGVSKCKPQLDNFSELPVEEWLLRQPHSVDKDYIERLLSKLTLEARGVSQNHCGSLVRVPTREQRMGLPSISMVGPRSNSSYQAFYTRQGAPFNHLELVEIQPSNCTLVKPSSQNGLALIRKVAPIMWFVKKNIK